MDSSSTGPRPLNCSLTAAAKAVRSPSFQSQTNRFFPLSFSVGRWIVIMIGRWSDYRVSSGSQSYLSRKAAWTIVTSGEEKAPVAGFCLVGCSGLLRNVLFSSMIYMIFASSIGISSGGVMDVDVISDHLCPLVYGWSSDNEMPVLCS